MGLFKKKREELPPEDFSLPEPTAMPPEDFSGFEDLPELPDLPPIDDFEAGRIKQEFRDPRMQLPAQRRGEKMKPVRIEMEDYEIQALPMASPRMDMQNMQPEYPAPFPTTFSGQAQQPARRIISPIERPIFVKIEKFRDSIENIHQIKNKLKSASSLIQKIKEIRQREDYELTSWEKELGELKTKLDSVDKKLFSDVE